MSKNKPSNPAKKPSDENMSDSMEGDENREHFDPADDDGKIQNSDTAGLGHSFRRDGHVIGDGQADPENASARAAGDTSVATDPAIASTITSSVADPQLQPAAGIGSAAQLTPEGQAAVDAGLVPRQVDANEKPITGADQAPERRYFKVKKEHAMMNEGQMQVLRAGQIVSDLSHDLEKLVTHGAELEPATAPAPYQSNR